MSKKPVKGRNLKLAPRFFRYQNSNNHNPEPRPVWHFVLEKVVEKVDGRIHRVYKGCKYPMKALPDPDFMYPMDVVKKVLMTFVMVGANRAMIPFYVLFALMPKKMKLNILNNFLSRFNTLYQYVFSHAVLKREHSTECSNAIEDFVANFLIAYGLDKDKAKITGECFGALIEYDDAYRYRIQDALSNTSYIGMLKNPRQEIKVFGSIIEDRDKQVGFKFQAFVKLLRLLLLIPSIKKSFRTALKSIKYHHLQLDEIDEYYCYMRTGYNFFGMTDEERVQEWIEMHEGKLPPQVQIIS